MTNFHPSILLSWSFSFFPFLKGHDDSKPTKRIDALLIGVMIGNHLVLNKEAN